MTETTTQSRFSQEAFDVFLDARQEPDWLLQLRRDAWDAFCEMDWPQRREEEWLRTDIRLFKLEKYAMPSSADPATTTDSAEPLLAENVELGGYTVSLDSRPKKSQLDEKWSAQGVLFGSLDELVREHGDLIRPHLFNTVDPHFDKFAALHAACWSGGQLLYVPRGVAVEAPLHILSLATNGGTDMGHTLVILEEGAEATLLQETVSTEEKGEGLHCGAVEIVQAPNSHLRYVNLQNWSQGMWHFGQAKATVDRDASLQWTLAAIGSRLAKVNQQVSLVGPGANCQVNGVLFTENKQHLSYHTLQHHQAPNCTSNFLYKSALQDRSRTVWRGMIKVDPAAQKTNGYQRNDNLLLSSAARADSIPGLEIEADDVRCTHGSTSGRVDEELIFYAQCRGYTRKEAIRLIVTGFFQQIFDRITIESVREALGHAIARRVRDYE